MKIKLVAAGAALCALGMTGCSNENDEAGAQAGKQVVMTMQSATDGPQTRADYTEDEPNARMNFSWRIADEMSVVVDGTDNENCKLTATEAGKSASFSGPVTGIEGTKTIYAFYPYNQAGYAVTGGDNSATATAALTLPATQLYTVGGAISNSFMVGVGTATATKDAITASVSMKQVMSIIKLNIINAPGKVTGVKLKCTEDLFPTTAIVKLSDATISNPDNKLKELSMTVTDNTTEATKAVSFAMFPTSELKEKYITIEVTFNDGIDDIVRMIMKKGVEFKRNTHYVMDFTGADNIEIEGIEVAIGNLVADGPNGAKIGTATDAGLFFQFGSLVGWSATGDPATIAVAPSNFNENNKDWSNTNKIWQDETNDVPFTDRGSDNEKAGVGDPCRYYLGNPWRLPTSDEFFSTLFLFEYNEEGWTWTGSSVFHGSGSVFPASGHRSNTDGHLTEKGQGYYWSATPYSSSSGEFLSFNADKVSTDTDRRAIGMPVRCVKESN